MTDTESDMMSRRIEANGPLVEASAAGVERVSYLSDTARTLVFGMLYRTPSGANAVRSQTGKWLAPVRPCSFLRSVLLCGPRCLHES